MPAMPFGGANCQLTASSVLTIPLQWLTAVGGTQSTPPNVNSLEVHLAGLKCWNKA
jgi:hypothetical protein